MALVAVLMVLVLMTALFVSLTSGAMRERRSAVTEDRNLSSAKLAETATNLVLSQVRKASTRPDALWASQPGAIRSYGSDDSFLGYKLYSGPNLVVTDEALLSADSPPAS
jgi:hypothetical protein